jgi:DNA-binding MarR family transcriptional regulator
MPTRRTAPGQPPGKTANRRVVDLERYAPALLNWIATKVSRGASQHYLNVFGVGIEIWRCLLLLAIEESISAQQVSRIIGMDKSSVSRCFKSMQAKGLITMGLDAADGRVRIATLTAQGRALHDRMIGMALERDRALLSALNDDERNTLFALLWRVHENLPVVERMTEQYIAARFPEAAGRRPTVQAESGDDA